MSNDNRFKRTGYCGKFLTAKETLPTPEEDFIPISKSKLIEIYEALLKAGKFQKEDLEWHPHGGIFSVPTCNLSRYKFGLSDPEIGFLIDKCISYGLECTSGVTFDKDGMLIASCLKAGSLFQKEDLLLALNLVQGFNLANRMCVMRLNVQEGISFDVLTSIHTDYATDRIAELCYYQSSLVVSFIKFIVTKKKTEFSEAGVHSFLRTSMGLPANSRLSFPSNGILQLNNVQRFKEQCEKQSFNAVISKDNEALIIKTELETRKSKFTVTLFISFSSWPSSLSMYCQISELDNQSLDWFKMNLGFGSSMVFLGNQSVEFVGNTLGASAFLFVPENSLANGDVFKNAELLLGFIEYQIDILEQGKE